MMLTKKTAIEKHRTMWNWIYKAIEKDMFPQFVSISQYKKEYIRDYEQCRPVQKNCYLCEYAHYRHGIECYECPLQWESLDGTKCMTCMAESSLYSYLTCNFKIMSKQLKLDYCRKIANLKERG